MAAVETVDTAIRNDTRPESAPLWLDHPRARREEVAGGKAAPLARLMETGVRVPPGFVVPVAAYQEAMGPLRGELERRLTELGKGPEGEALEACAAALREV